MAGIDPGAVIREYRKDRGWTGAELARRSKMSPAQISKIEKNIQTLRMPTLMRIAKALGIKPCVFLMTEDDRDLFDSVGDVRW